MTIVVSGGRADLLPLPLPTRGALECRKGFRHRKRLPAVGESGWGPQARRLQKRLVGRREPTDVVWAEAPRLTGTGRHTATR